MLTIQLHNFLQYMQKTLLRRSYIKFGPPHKLGSDRGIVYVNQGVTQLCSGFEIKRAPRTPL